MTPRNSSSTNCYWDCGTRPPSRRSPADSSGNPQHRRSRRTLRPGVVRSLQFFVVLVGLALLLAWASQASAQISPVTLAPSPVNAEPVSGPTPTASPAPLAAESPSLAERLARQEAEIEWLRARLLETRPDLRDPPPPAEDPAWATELQQVMQRLNELERRELTMAPAKTAAPSTTGIPASDEWVDVSNEKWNVRLGGHVQLDLINWAQTDPAISNAQDYFEFRRLRLLADGTGYGFCDFRLQITLEPETIGENLPGVIMSPDVKDAYFSMNEIPGLGRLRIGNFFVPFGLEQVTNDTNNIFMERSIPTQGVFTPDREVGMAIYNTTEDKSISWAYGIFLDSIGDGVKERIDDNQGYRLSGRLNWVPYYDEPSNGRYVIHTGAGVLHTDDQDNRARFRARPQIHEGPRLIDSGILAAESYTTGNLEFAAVWGRVTLQSEVFVTSVHMLPGDSANLTGMYAHLSYFITGENRIYERFGQHGAQFARNSPFSNFFIVPGGWSPGAWEVKTRWSNLNLDDVDRGQYNDLTVGLNWYWSDRTRVMFDWIHPYTTAEAVFGTTQSDILAMRFDFNW